MPRHEIWNADTRQLIDVLEGKNLHGSVNDAGKKKWKYNKITH